MQSTVKVVSGIWFDEDDRFRRYDKLGG